jgi:hypothetical protein
MYRTKLLSLAFLCGCPSPKDTGNDTGDTGNIEVSNQGPQGLASAENDCGPADGDMTTFHVNLSEDTCGAEPDPNWNVKLSVLGTVESGTVYDLDSGLWVAQFNDEGEHIATAGQVVLEFEGEWEDGINFTGSYVLDGDFHLIEGAFSGQFCEIEKFCG